MKTVPQKRFRSNANPSLTVTKEAEVIHVGSDDASAPVTRAEDRIDYTISIENTGNVTLDNLVVKDILTDGAGNALELKDEVLETPQHQASGRLIHCSRSSQMTFNNVSYTIGETAALTGSIINQLETSQRQIPDGTEVTVE